MLTVRVRCRVAVCYIVATCCCWQLRMILFGCEHERSSARTELYKTSVQLLVLHEIKLVKQIFTIIQAYTKKYYCHTRVDQLYTEGNALFYFSTFKVEARKAQDLPSYGRVFYSITSGF